MTKNQRVQLRLRVSAAAQKHLRSGHPWLFASSVREQNRAGHLGELAVIFDRNDHFLAIGLFDPDSPLRVRILHSGKPQKIDANWWKNRLANTIEKRAKLFDAGTNGFRCINGESDGWPGLVLDRYDKTFVLKIYTAAWLPRLNELVPVFSEFLPGERIVLRMSRNILQIAQSEFQLSDGQILFGKVVSEPVVFRENGLSFEAEVLHGQKTGFFLDQRENRSRVQKFSKDREVLNAFSFSGGFSLYAAHGGARSVTDLDISSHALESAKRNFALNRENAFVKNCRHNFIQADAFEWLGKNLDQQFDLVILDPPSLAKRESERAGAIAAYGKLARNGIAHLRKGGVLVAASCSAHVSENEFFESVRTAARDSGRRFSELETSRHAPDHPATFPEAHYLKCIYLRF
jgi:23S rRNA (cytosine1962-C5)-methyltransferase